MINQIDKAYIGQELINQDFETWSRYLFRVIEQKPFEIEEIHKDLFSYFQAVINGHRKRININIPPRSGKTTLAKYLLIYTLTKNPKANIIYTSYSQSLLTDIALSCKSFLESPVYKALYPSTFNFESEETNPIDDFWRDYRLKDTNGQKNTYSSKKISTRQGGICLFSAIGGQITGYGAGIRGNKEFNGFLCIDDANKPGDIHSQVMREKVFKYYKETLLSRLNDSNVPIINIQQRLHLEDLSGFLKEKYNFETLKKPLIDETGKCLLPKQYTPERIKEIKIDNYVFQSQYQQEPIFAGGQIIKREWFNYYPDIKFNYKKIVIAADTAISSKEYADYSCFLVGGITQDNKLHILDMIHGRWEYPELKQQAINIFNKWQLDKRETSASSFVIENKASGQQLIQDFKKAGLPIRPIDVTKDKLSRVEEVLDYLANGNILLPISETYGFNPKLIAECESFTRDQQQLHDDIVDTLVHLINNTIAKRQVSILDVL